MQSYRFSSHQLRVLARLAQRLGQAIVHPAGHRMNRAIDGAGQTDIEALRALLSQQPNIDGSEPGLADFAVLGQVAPMARWNMRTPVADAIKQNQAVMDWCARLIAAYLA